MGDLFNEENNQSQENSSGYQSEPQGQEQGQSQGQPQVGANQQGQAAQPGQMQWNGQGSQLDFMAQVGLIVIKSHK